MKIKIGNRVFTDVNWNVGSNYIGMLQFYADESIEHFMGSISDNDSVEQYDGEVMVGKWVNHGVESIRRCDFGADGVMMEIQFKLTTINQNAETALQTGVEENSDAVIELAQVLEEIETRISDLEERLNAIENGVE